MSLNPGRRAATVDLRSGRRLWVRMIAGLILAGLLGLGLAAAYIARHAEPIVRERIIQTLSQVFNSPVELDELHLSVVKGFEVQGRGLRIPFGVTPQGANTSKKLKPLLSVESFRFRTSVRSLLHRTAHIEVVRLEGMQLHIPPTSQRPALLGTREGRLPADPHHPSVRPRLRFTVGEIEATDGKLFIETDEPGKQPLEFDLRRIQLENPGGGGPSRYMADLVNPKPVGDILAHGHFGPWNGDDPRATHVDGDYTLAHADLNTIKGIGGMLSSAGHFDGVLECIAIQGDTDTPNFSLDVSDRPVPLHTHFQAHVDGTDGDTYLDRVDARLGQTSFATHGKVVKVDGGGHDIALDVDMGNGRIQDLLLLGVKSRPPLMNGVLALQARLHIPPGRGRVIEKLDLRGRFRIHEVHFNNPKLQDRVNGLSARAQGRPQDVALLSTEQLSTNQRAQAASEMSARFTLAHGLLTAKDVHYVLPGALLLLHGIYSTDGNLFEFKGHVQTQARASEMVSGWKRWLLKPVDPFLARHDAGLELPIEVSGSQGDVQVGLALKDADEPSGQMVNDLKQKRTELREQARAKREGRPASVRSSRSAAETVQLEREGRRQMFAASQDGKPSPVVPAASAPPGR